MLARRDRQLLERLSAALYRSILFCRTLLKGIHEIRGQGIETLLAQRVVDGESIAVCSQFGLSRQFVSFDGSAVSDGLNML
jgi:hypothetical protein